MKKYKAVIFDLDGTLLNTLDDLTDAVNYMLREFHYPERTLQEIRSFVGNGIVKLVERVLPEGKNNPEFEQAFSCFESFYTKNCQVKTDAYPGTRELIHALADKGYEMAIVSNKNDAAVKELIPYYFGDTIQIALGVTEALNKKPAPDMVYAAMAALGADLDTTNAIYIGDSEVDKQTADHAGLNCVLCSWGFRERELLESLKPLAIIDNPMELLKILEEK